ncbi:MAG: serine protease [Pseudomonadota bacterium]
MDNDSIKERIRDNHHQIARTLNVVNSGNPYAAEPDRTRRIDRLQTKANLSRSAAAMIDSQIEMLGKMPEAQELASPDGVDDSDSLDDDGTDGAEKIWGDSVDFVNVSFLEKGARIARSVGRVAYRSNHPQGSGFLIGEGLFLTNYHVVDSEQLARSLMLQFDYETDITGSQKEPTNFAIDTSIFITSDDTRDGLDYALFLVGPRLKGDKPIEYFGWSGLSDASDKHMLGEFANVVQHPQGRFKEVVLRENRLVARGGDALHYVADTEPGSSGSPVFNSEWRPIALHHWGSPWADVFGEDGHRIDRNVNEGIRISSIVHDIRSKLSNLTPENRARVERALHHGAQPEAAGDHFIPDYCDLSKGAAGASGPTVSPDGRINWTVPVEISVGIPSLAQRPAQTDSEFELVLPPVETEREAREAAPARTAPARKAPARKRRSRAKMKK